MADPALALQDALKDWLKADAALADLVGTRVYDEPPQTGAHPFVRLGNFDLYPFRTDGCAAWRIMFSIEAHSRPVAGRVEATKIAHAVVTALEDRQADIAVAGFTLAWVEFITQTVSRDPDGKSYTAITAFEAVLDV